MVDEGLHRRERQRQKSSLVFDTIYTEAQRQLLETFSTYARHRVAGARIGFPETPMPTTKKEQLKIEDYFTGSFIPALAGYRARRPRRRGAPGLIAALAGWTRSGVLSCLPRTVRPRARRRDVARRLDVSLATGLCPRARRGIA